MAARRWYSGDTHNHRDPAELPNVMPAEDVNVALPMVYWTTVDQVSPRRSSRSMKGDFPAALREIDPTHVYWPRNTEYEIFNTGGTNHTLGALLVVNHRTVFDLPSLPLREVAARARKEGALLDLEKHNWNWSAALVAIVRPDLFELANNHHWRVEYSVTNWAVPAPAWMRIGTGTATERDWTLYGFQNYYALLNCGFRLMPAAGTANGVHPVPLGFSRVYVQVPWPFTFDGWMRGLKEGRSFVTTGPMLFVRFNGEEPGHVFSGRLRREQNVSIEGEVWSEQPLERVEVVALGELMHSLKPKSEKQESGAYRTTFSCRAGWRDSGWVAVRCFERREGDRFRFAHTAPVFFDVPGHPLHPRRAEAEWLAQRVREEIERSGPLLPPKGLEEYRRALAVYEAMLDETR
jgi:hypothetical protein